jgi:hypothetical protein
MTGLQKARRKGFQTLDTLVPEEMVVSGRVKKLRRIIRLMACWKTCSGSESGPIPIGG